MKKNIIAPIFVLLLFTAGLINQASAQAHSQGQLGVSANIGYNLTSLIFRVISTGSEAVGSVPPVSGAIDYGISDRFSLGVAVTYQGAGLTITDTISGIQETFKANFSCTNVGIRPLFHFGSSDDLDFYAGIRLSTTIWSSNTESSNPDYDPVSEFNLGARRIRLQPVAGIAYFFGNGPIGLNAEIATAPYLVAIGAKLRL
ncbi:MAG: outer membrane beta-barrel protein [Bacteroidetes bacterium]|nr:outer membrane beta-barrel protein [Bacteroidota bacterium]MCB0842220.1 outer membrane beta-barrel protein [Bacteroidota bacterium]